MRATQVREEQAWAEAGVQHHHAHGVASRSARVDWESKLWGFA